MINEVTVTDEGYITINLELTLEGLDSLRNGETIPMGYKNDDTQIMIFVKSGKTDKEIFNKLYGWVLPVLETTPIIEESAFRGKIQNSEEEMRENIKEFIEKLKKDENLKDLFSETLTNMMAEGLTHKLCKFLRLVK